MKQVIAPVISNEKLVSETGRYPRNTLGSYLMWLHCPEIAKEAKPGQFVMVNCGQDCVLPRPFSIHQANEDDIALFYTVWEGGKGTSWLSRCKAGNKIELFGPLGNRFSLKSTWGNLLLVAGGMGIAPLYFLAQQALRRGYSVSFLYGTRTEHRYPENLLPFGISLFSFTEDGSFGGAGMTTDYLSRFVSHVNQIFACGPLPMYKTMAQMPELENIPVQVSLEVVMGCGRGVCYGCTIKTKGGLKRVCEHGPVFDLDDILWDDPVFTTGFAPSA